MANTKDLTISGLWLKILAYAKSGAGKTYFSGTFPKPYFFDFDKGMLTLRGRDIEYDTYVDETRNGVVTRSAMQQLYAKLDAIEAGEVNCDTVVLDSVTTASAFMLDTITRLNGHSIPSLPDWGLAITELTSLIIRLCALPKHVVVTAHEELVKDEVSGDVLVRPLVMGRKLPGQLPLYFDETYHLETRKKGDAFEYRMLTRSTTRHTAKSRLGVLDSYDIPDYTHIMAKVQDKEVPMKK